MIYAQNIGDSLFFFEQIPSKRLKNAIQSYASPMKEDETAILLYDDTVFNSGKDGFLLTSKRLYVKNFQGTKIFANLADISSLDVKHGSMSSDITCFLNSENSFNIKITNMMKKQNAAVFRVLNETIELLKGETSPSAANTSKDLRCRGCGANYNGLNICEYCGTHI